MPPDMQEVHYSVDIQDRIASVCDEWLEFARENDWVGLDESDLIGRPIFEFIEGEETQRIYRTIFQRVRHHQRSVTLPLRCDGPDVRRFIELEIRPAEQGRIEMSGRLVRQETRKPVRFFDRKASRSQQAIAMCAWCKKIPVEGEWQEVEEAVARLDLFQAPELPAIRYDVCDVCRNRIKNESEGG